MSTKPVLSLYRVFAAGRVVLGTFGKRHQAVAAMTAHNKKLKQGERPAWVGPGPDHWREKPGNIQANAIPQRGPDYRWIPDEIFRAVAQAIKPDEWLEWYVSTKDVAYA